MLAAAVFALVLIGGLAVVVFVPALVVFAAVVTVVVVLIALPPWPSFSSRCRGCQQS
jgi:hypothetical protein